MNILSLFDGISCGQLALTRANISYTKYFASEIDSKAIQITQKNFPNTIQLGNILNINSKDLPPIDLLIGGSPCQGFSISGKKLNFEDPRSKLFFEYLRLKNELNPKYFLLENVKMPPNIANVIDEEMKVKHTFIDSRYFTGHIRKRFYWTNLPINDYLKKDIKLKDIIDNTLPFDKDANFLLDRTIYSPTTSRDGIITINPRDKNNKQTWQRGRIYSLEGYCPTICATLFDLNITRDHKFYRKLSINECEKLQGVPFDYTAGISSLERGKCLGNGWTVDVIAHILSSLK